MILERVVVNQLSADAYRWYLSFLEAFEGKSPNACGAYLAEHCTLEMNNLPLLSGREGVLRGMGSFWSAFGTLEHEPRNIYGTDRAFVLESLNHYTREDGRPITLRAVLFTDRDEAGLITSLRIDAETTPLYMRASR